MVQSLVQVGSRCPAASHALASTVATTTPIKAPAMVESTRRLVEPITSAPDQQAVR
jgi:hypothetical protein